MSDDDKRDLQAVLESIVARRLEESLGVVEEALARWRKGESSVLVAHAEVMRHAARAGALVDRVGRAALDGPQLLLRDGFASGLVSREEFLRLAGRAPEEVEPPPSLDEEAGRQPTPPSPDKRTILEKLLAEGAVLVHLDARLDEVTVPPAHKVDPRLVLRLGYRLTPPIPDLRIDADGVRATLSFHGSHFGCVLPWRSIYAIVSEEGRGLVWPEDMPAEVASELARERPAEREGEASGAPPAAPGGPGDEPQKPPPTRRGHLRLV